MEIRYRRELYKLLPDQAVVAELGCAEGLFSLDILKWPNTKLLYMVDMWECHPEFPGDAGASQEWHNKNYSDAMERVKGFPVEVLRGPTVAMADFVENESLGLVYVDACHSYECVKADIRAWWPKLKSGGVIAFHDYEMSHYGVKQAVTEFVQFMNDSSVDNSTISINLLPEDKQEDAGAWIKKP